MKPLSFSHLSIKKVKRPKGQESLFPIDFHYVINDICPKSLTKLYWNLKKTAIMCRKKGCNFFLPAKSYYDIISGKRLEQWKEQDTFNRR